MTHNSIIPKQSSGESLWHSAWMRFRENRLAVAGSIWLAAITLLSVFAPLIAPYSYQAQDLALGAIPPNLKHLLGTDILGRDLFSRLLYGGRISLAVGVCATAVALFIGVLYGAIAGYAGNKVDALMMRIVDVIYAFPFTIFVIILMVLFGRNIVLLFCAIGAVEWLTMARIVRGQIMSLKKQEFVEAAITLGLSNRVILTRHLLPNVVGPIIVYASLTVPNVIILESFLSFLGLGVQPPMSSWGSLIKEGAETMESYPWLLIFPGLLFSFTLFALNSIGDGMRDALDPHEGA